MEQSEVKIGMRVVPTDKTVNDWFDLDESIEWQIAQRKGQPFLFVTEWNPDDACWCLSHENIPDTNNADFFNASDFYLYVSEDDVDLVEPSALELAIMNASALELEAQFK